MRPSPRRITAAVAALALAAAGVVALAPPASAASGDLLFSEYIEGSSNNKALEIYNPTTAPVDLAGAGYKVQQYSNGGLTAGVTITLTGTIAADGVFVFAHSSANAEILAAANQTLNTGLFNGNDAVALVKDDVIVDVIGQIGFDPTTEWGSGLSSTMDNTLRRAADICVGDADGTNTFDPSVGWIGFASNTASGLGTHDADCALPPATDPDPDPDPDPVPVADCDLDAVTIGSVQGSGATAQGVGQVVRIEGTVVGDFQQVGGFDGYYVQDLGDGNTATSDGIFVFAPSGLDVQPSDVVSIAGTVAEFFGLTQLTSVTVDLCAEDAALPTAAALSLPATEAQREAVEGMLVTVPQPLTILEYFEYGRFGTLDLGLDRQYQPTATYLPGTPEAAAEAASNLAERITLDDGRGDQNPDPLRHPNGQPFGLENNLRGGDTLSAVTGVLDWRFSTWAIQPTQQAVYNAANPRPAVSDVRGDLVVSSYNVLNYFTTLNLPGSGDDDIARGAESPLELSRQQAKIIDALAEIDADVFGLIEIENNGDLALKTLTDALNARLKSDVYAYVPTGKIGTDVITTALMYKPATVEPLGAYKLMNGTADPAWDDNLHRPGLTQTFGAIETDEKFTVVVNHLKSKGSACATGNDAQQGNCNGPRTAAATALAKWLATDPTGQGTVGRELIIGDLNSYDKEDPIRALTSAGYTDLLLKYTGEDAYTYVFDGQLGYLDHGLAGPGLLADVTGAAPWNINSDEAPILDYNVNFKSASQITKWFAPDAFRSSDHDPVIVGIDLDTVPPTIEVTASPARIWPPNNKPRTVTITVDAADDSGAVTYELIDSTADGNKKAEITQLSKTTFSVIAAIDSVYTFTYEATDAAGNTAESTAEVRVGR